MARTWTLGLATGLTLGFMVSAGLDWLPEPFNQLAKTLIQLGCLIVVLAIWARIRREAKRSRPLPF